MRRKTIVKVKTKGNDERLMRASEIRTSRKWKSHFQFKEMVSSERLTNRLMNSLFLKEHER